MRVARSHFFWMRREDAWARAQRTPSNHTGAIRIGGGVERGWIATWTGRRVFNRLIELACQPPSRSSAGNDPGSGYRSGPTKVRSWRNREVERDVPSIRICMIAKACPGICSNQTAIRMTSRKDALEIFPSPSSSAYASSIVYQRTLEEPSYIW